MLRRLLPSSRRARFPLAHHNTATSWRYCATSPQQQTPTVNKEEASSVEDDFMFDIPEFDAVRATPSTLQKKPSSKDQLVTTQRSNADLGVVRENWDGVENHVYSRLGNRVSDENVASNASIIAHKQIVLSDKARQEAQREETAEAMKPVSWADLGLPELADLDDSPAAPKPPRATERSIRKAIGNDDLGKALLNAADNADFEAEEEEQTNLLERAESEEIDKALPFDSVYAAEQVLEMSNDGQLDESWQESGFAKIEDVKALGDILRQMKARDIAAIRCIEKTSAFDYIMCATCEGQRHLALCAWAVSEADRYKRANKPKRRQTSETWEVVPVGRIVVNLLTEDHREEMAIERKWAVRRKMDAMDLAKMHSIDGREVKSHGLWSLTLNLKDLEDFEVDYCVDELMSQL